MVLMFAQGFTRSFFIQVCLLVLFCLVSNRKSIKKRQRGCRNRDLWINHFDSALTRIDLQLLGISSSFFTLIRCVICHFHTFFLSNFLSPSLTTVIQVILGFFFAEMQYIDKISHQNSPHLQIHVKFVIVKSIIYQMISFFLRFM